jgi:hypothetical protein
VNQDPLLGKIPLGMIGTLYGIALIVLIQRSLTASAGRALASAQNLSFLGAFVSVLLVLRALYETGGFCVWCLAHATLCVSASISLALSSTAQTRLRLAPFGLVAAGFFVCWGGLLQVGAAQLSSISTSSLASINREQLLGDSIPLAELHAGRSPRFVVFVELGCPSCIAVLRSVRRSKHPELVRARFISVSADYDRQAACLQENVQCSGYYELLDFILAAGPDKEHLERFIATHGGLRPSRGELHGVDLAKRLRIFATPTVVRIDGAAPQPCSTQELMNEIGA